MPDCDEDANVFFPAGAFTREDHYLRVSDRESELCYLKYEPVGVNLVRVYCGCCNCRSICSERTPDRPSDATDEYVGSPVLRDNCNLATRNPSRPKFRMARVGYVSLDSTGKLSRATFRGHPFFF